MTKSVLDDIEGVGPTRKKALMRRFGSMKKLRAATEEEIAETPGIPRAVAESVYNTLQAWSAEEEGRKEELNAQES